MAALPAMPLRREASWRSHAEWATERVSYEIRVNTVIPAEIMTPLYHHWLETFPNSDEMLQTIVAKIPLERRMTSV
jgi:L-fucose dehydrogenase